VSDERTTIGWREWVALPALGVAAIKAKVDTGARTSSLHAFDLEPFDKDGERWVRFGVHPVQRRDDVEVLVEHPLHELREVRSSNGEVEERPVIVTSLVLGGFTHDIEVTLTNRDEMGFRMLLGREAMRDRYQIDPGSSFHTGLDDAARAVRRATPPRPRD